MSEIPQQSQQWEVPFSRRPTQEFLGLLGQLSVTLCGNTNGWLESLTYGQKAVDGQELGSVKLLARPPYTFEVGEYVALRRTDQDPRQPANISHLGDSASSQVIFDRMNAGNMAMIESMSAQTQFRLLYSLIAAALQDQRQL